MNSYFEYISALGLLELTGVFGFLIYILAFGAVQFSVLDGNGAAYSVLNVLAATCVAISLMAEFNLSSALIQASWIIIGLSSLAMRFIKNRNAQPISSNVPFQGRFR